jgi:hypothetical protein
MRNQLITPVQGYCLRPIGCQLQGALCAQQCHRAQIAVCAMICMVGDERAVLVALCNFASGIDWAWDWGALWLLGPCMGYFGAGGAWHVLGVFTCINH